MRITIFAARRVLPPDLMTPANASKPFMNDTGPEAVPPPASSSRDERIVDRFEPVPEPYLKSMPSVFASVEDRLHRVLHGVDEAGRALRVLLEADVEPDRAVERGLLIDEQVLELVAERLEVVFAREVLLLARPLGDRVDDAADQLLDAALALGRADLPAEVLRDHDVGGLLRPETGDLDVALLEDDRALFVADDGRADLPFDLVERIDPFAAEEPLELQARRRRAVPMGAWWSAGWWTPPADAQRLSAYFPLRIAEPRPSPRRGDPESLQLCPVVQQLPATNRPIGKASPRPPSTLPDWPDCPSDFAQGAELGCPQAADADGCCRWSPAPSTSQPHRPALRAAFDGAKAGTNMDPVYSVVKPDLLHIVFCF